jgi:hypothetical protein
LLSAITASIAYTLSETKLFEPLRAAVARRSTWLGKLVACGYCAGHWVAFALCAVYQPRVLRGAGWLDLVLTAFLVAWIAGAQWAAMAWLVGRAGR